uniref:PucR family transcriptional regulator n=1 Tax=Rhodococcus qingshengii TaxID=334542 RepID=UPI001C4E0FA3|nr:helix-turn-helix domain-containing protein [Rhodococcus qingshengii]
MSSTGIEDWVCVVEQRLREIADDIVAEELRRMRTEAPDFFTSDDPSYVQAYTASCKAHLGVILDGLKGGRDVPTLLPPAAAEEIRTVAEWGIPLDALLQTYRTAHSVIWDTVLDVVSELIPNKELSTVLKVISRYLFSYTDRMIDLLTTIYNRERLALFQDRNKQRRQLIRDILDGLPVDSSRLPYTLTETHVAGIARAQDIDRQIAHMAQTAHVNSLTVAGPSESTWVWFGGNNLATTGGMRALIESVPAGLSISFGEPGQGIEGFRTSHVEARQSHRIARKTNREVIRYAEIALLSLVTIDETLAATFMRRELGFLATDGPRIRELRETLSTYFKCGHNASHTAAKMSLNDRTVAYRLRSIEKNFGYPILDRRGELEVALQLMDLYGASSEAGSNRQ